MIERAPKMFYSSGFLFTRTFEPNPFSYRIWVTYLEVVFPYSIRIGSITAESSEKDIKLFIRQICVSHLSRCVINLLFSDNMSRTLDLPRPPVLAEFGASESWRRL